MEIIRILCNICKTPVFTGVLFLLSYQITYSWIDTKHVIPKYIYMGIGAEYYNYSPMGFNGSVKANNDTILYTIDTYFTDSVPIISRLSYRQSDSIDYSLSTREKKDSYLSFFIELKTPFTVDFLSRETRFYISYSSTRETFSTKANNNIYIKDSYLNKGDPLSLGEKDSLFQIAFDTPITSNDSLDSYSRFGLYYNETENIRNIIYSMYPENIYLLGVKERHGGIFYEMMKPAFIDNLSANIYLSAGIGGEELIPNQQNIKSSDFRNSVLFYTNIRLGLGYTINFTTNLKLKLYGNYIYSTTLLITKESNSKIINSDTQKYNLGGRMVLSF